MQRHYCTYNLYAMTTAVSVVILVIKIVVPETMMTLSKLRAAVSEE